MVSVLLLLLYRYYLCFLLIEPFIDISRLKKYRKFVRGHINDAVLVSPPVGVLSEAVGGGPVGSLWVACGRDKGVSKGDFVVWEQHTANMVHLWGVHVSMPPVNIISHSGSFVNREFPLGVFPIRVCP
jgi:hypothetical protein